MSKYILLSIYEINELAEALRKCGIEKDYNTKKKDTIQYFCAAGVAPLDRHSEKRSINYNRLLEAYTIISDIMYEDVSDKVFSRTQACNLIALIQSISLRTNI